MNIIFGIVFCIIGGYLSEYLLNLNIINLGNYQFLITSGVFVIFFSYIILL